MASMNPENPRSIEFQSILTDLQSYDHKSYKNGYIEYYPGDEDSFILLTVGHGGGLEPANIPKRSKPPNEPLETSKRVAVRKDACTMEMTIVLWKELWKLLKSRPHMVINHLHRRKVDVNREEVIGTSDHKDSRAAWRAYHAYIEEARREIIGRHNRGLLLDIHGHQHDGDYIELGYAIPPASYGLDMSRVSESSIQDLVRRTGLTLSDLTVGDLSLGHLFEVEGHPALPSPQRTDPSSFKYYSGGFTIQTWGSRKGDHCDAIQLELPRKLRFNEYNSTSKMLARVLERFIRRFYFDE